MRRDSSGVSTIRCTSEGGKRRSIQRWPCLSVRSRRPTMTKAECIKLVTVVLVVLVVCLPEFFPSLQVRTDVSCHQFESHQEESWCDIQCHSSESGGERQDCINSSMKDRNHTTAGNVTSLRETGWFLCGYDARDLDVAHHYILLAAQSMFTDALNRTINLDIKQLRLCCCSGLVNRATPHPFSYNHTCCMFLTRGESNSTHVNGTLWWTHPEAGFWSCMYRVVWLTLILTTVVLVVTAVAWHVVRRRPHTSETLQLPASMRRPVNLPMEHSGDVFQSQQCKVDYIPIQSRDLKGLYTIYEAEETDGVSNS